MKILGDSGDISNLFQFDWFDWCKYRDSSQCQEIKLGRVLGPARNHSNEMAQWILINTMNIIPRRTCRSLIEEETRSTILKREMDNIMAKVRQRYGDKLKVSKEARASATVKTVIDDDDDDYNTFILYEDDVEEPRVMPEQDADGPKDSHVKPIIIDDVNERYINAEVRLSKGGDLIFRKVVSTVLDKDGKRIGTPHKNPFLNTMLYEVELEDGTTRAYGANVIAETMWNTVNNEGNHKKYFGIYSQCPI